MRSFPLDTGLAILSVAMLLAGARFVAPSVQMPRLSQAADILEFGPVFPAVTPTAEPALPSPVLPPRPTAKNTTTPVLLEDADGGLEHFYAALWRSEKKEPGAVTRIVHYGDSPTTADLITGDIRSQLQKSFGEAGHGFVLIAKPWAWYQHRDVQMSGSGWQMVPASQFRARDGMFGLGGVSFVGAGSASSQIKWQRGAYNRFEVWYLKEPGGGAFAVTADGQALGEVETAAAEKGPGFAPFQLETPAKELSLRVTRGQVRLFGVSSENGAAGVVYSSLGLNGASITVLSRMFNQSHWAAELQHDEPDLVVINYGTNEADFGDFVDHQYERELREALRRVRAALPETSILVMSPMDRGYRNAAGEIVTMDTIPRIVAMQRRVARETGCGFFDTFDAMGGAGTMARWYTAQPRLVSADFIHPYPAGGKMIATVFTQEIARGLNRHKLRLTTRVAAFNTVR